MAFGGVQSRQMENLVHIITLACSPGRTISTLTEMTLEEEIMEWEKWAEIKPESSAGGVSLPAEQPSAGRCSSGGVPAQILSQLHC